MLKMLLWAYMHAMIIIRILLMLLLNRRIRCRGRKNVIGQVIITVTTVVAIAVAMMCNFRAAINIGTDIHLHQLSLFKMSQ